MLNHTNTDADAAIEISIQITQALIDRIAYLGIPSRMAERYIGLRNNGLHRGGANALYSP